MTSVLYVKDVDPKRLLFELQQALPGAGVISILKTPALDTGLSFPDDPVQVCIQTERDVDASVLDRIVELHTPRLGDDVPSPSIPEPAPTPVFRRLPGQDGLAPRPKLVVPGADRASPGDSGTLVVPGLSRRSGSASRRTRTAR